MVRRCCALVLTLAALGLLASTLSAQVPGVTPPPPPLPPVGGAVGVGQPAAPGVAGVPPAAAAPRNLWSMLCPTPEQCAAWIQRLCSIPLFQFFGPALAPARFMSGGLMPRICPGPLDAIPADLLKDPTSAEGAAARIKEKEAQAKARRAAVRYLGTVDCRRYPEAEAALINALRGDENECVRWEAALALGRGCCCTKKVLQALVDTVSGKKTTEPAETSERVKLAAAAALEHCLMLYCEVVVAGEDEIPPEKPPEEKPPETPPEPGAPPKLGDRVTRSRPDPLIAEARRALALHRPVVPQSVEPRSVEPAPALPGKVKPAPASADMASAVIHLTPILPPATSVAQMAAVPPQATTNQPEAETGEKPGRKSRDVFNVFREALRGR